MGVSQLSRWTKVPKRTHAPTAAALAKGQGRGPLTQAVETCEQLYASLKWAAHTDGIPAAKEQHLQAARAHIVKIVELIGTR